MPRDIYPARNVYFLECGRFARLNVYKVTVLRRVLVRITRTTAMAIAAPRRQTSMADDNRGVSVVPSLLPQPTSPPPPPPSPPPPPPLSSSLPSPSLLVTVVALRARRAVVSGAHRVHMYATYLSPFSEINKQCRGHSSRAPAGKHSFRV
ncbi:hypothetical protein EAG_01690 [Camponotus floridanus]|uniref:Uncharacterized protein n=1 Tax=Camponotus floridanus TaxID=104421 RepID=E2ADJ8_CAMFO|nr:hypothetical protein EAG_01690 [Camponotus floridanus]